jgi:lysophospholipase L1-like esterase
MNIRGRSSRAGTMLRDLLKALAVAIVLLVGIEVVIRIAYAVRNSMVQYVILPYAAAQDFGPVPPWMDGLRILEPDEVLSWRNRRSVSQRYLDVYSPVRFEEDRVRLLERFFPSVPADLQHNPVWSVSLNSRGFRGGEFSKEKKPGVVRILCIGDSWTFGANVDDAAAWPRRLETRLAEEYGPARFEVLNLGVMGYSSFQGLELLRRTGMELDPDLVLIGFGMNDGSVGGWRDRDHFGRPAARPAAVGRAIGNLQSLALLRYTWTRLRYRHWSIGDYMKRVVRVIGTPDEAWLGVAGSQFADYDALEPYTRVSPRDYERNVGEMVSLARSRDARVMLLYNSLWDTPYRDALQRIASAEEVPLIDSQALIAQARAAIEAQLERKLDLRPPEPIAAADGPDVEVVFRVYAAEHSVSKAMYISGTHPALGDAAPNRVATYDDGTHGDQRAGDSVWSYAVPMKVGTTVVYVYTNSGDEGRWEGMDVPDLRRVTVTASNTDGRLYRPIESFGQLYLQADGLHTNAAGYELIAAAVVEAMRRDHSLRSLF